MKRRPDQANELLNLFQASNLLRYDPDTGFLWWRVHRTGPARAGDRAGWERGANGWGGLKVLGRGYQAHRICWLLHYGVWPDGDIIHINGDKADNRIDNLKLRYGEKHAEHN